jgi:hypothetical protein
MITGLAIVSMVLLFHRLFGRFVLFGTSPEPGTILAVAT